jgi:hypothetical protein
MLSNPLEAKPIGSVRYVWPPARSGFATRGPMTAQLSGGASLRPVAPRPAVASRAVSRTETPPSGAR